jgi:hypothetical protein
MYTEKNKLPLIELKKRTLRWKRRHIKAVNLFTKTDDDGN